MNRADHGAHLLRRHPQAKQFRKAWDAERKAEDSAGEDEIIAELDAKFSRTRVAYETYRRIEADENGEPLDPIDWPRPFGFEEEE